MVSASMPEAAELVDQPRSRHLDVERHHVRRVAFMRSRIAARIGEGDASGSSMSMMIQPNSGPGVQDLARCSVYSKPCVTSRPTTRAPPFENGIGGNRGAVQQSLDLARGEMPAILADCLDAGQHADRLILRCVDGVFARKIRLFFVVIERRSVNVPPTSTPSLMQCFLQKNNQNESFAAAQAACVRVG